MNFLHFRISYSESELASGWNFLGSRIPIPGIRNREFLFWARSKNPENPEKIPKEKS